MSSIDSNLTAADRQTLLDLATASIAAGLDDESLQVNSGDYPAVLQALRASFVTLNIAGNLRGCIGVLDAHQALVQDVVTNAHSAAFRDPRFPALTSAEFERIDIHLSILSAPEPMQFADETDVLAQMRVGVDGLILEDGHHRSTFLPSVWESLHEPREFLYQLKRKAGLADDYWSDTIQIQRYTTEAIP